MPRGGYRPGSGPKKGTKYKTKKAAAEQETFQKNVSAEAERLNLTPLEYMLQVMNDPSAEKDRRDKMAALAVSFCHSKPGDRGKKAEQQGAAQTVASGRFGTSKAPTIVPIKKQG